MLASFLIKRRFLWSLVVTYFFTLANTANSYAQTTIEITSTSDIQTHYQGQIIQTSALIALSPKTAVDLTHVVFPSGNLTAFQSSFFGLLIGNQIKSTPIQTYTYWMTHTNHQALTFHLIFGQDTKITSSTILRAQAQIPMSGPALERVMVNQIGLNWASFKSFFREPLKSGDFSLEQLFRWGQSRGSASMGYYLHGKSGQYQPSSKLGLKLSRRLLHNLDLQIKVNYRRSISQAPSKFRIGLGLIKHLKPCHQTDVGAFDRPTLEPQPEFQITHHIQTYQSEIKWPSNQSSLTSIPKHLFQTLHDKSVIPESIHQARENFAADFEYFLLNDDDIRVFLAQRYPQYINLFEQLKGAHRADIARYLLLFEFGGLYLDIKTQPLVELSDWFSHPHLVSVLAADNLNTTKPKTVYQGVLASPRQNPFFIQLVQQADANLDKIQKQYTWLIQDFYQTAASQVMDRHLSTGLNSSLFPESIPDFYFFQEYCGKGNTSSTGKTCHSPDWRGLCCYIGTQDNPEVFYGRVWHYPWNRQNSQ